MIGCPYIVYLVKVSEIKFRLFAIEYSYEGFALCEYGKDCHTICRILKSIDENILKSEISQILDHNSNEEDYWICDNIFKYSKSELKQFAKDVDVKNYNSLKKEELIYQILNSLSIDELQNLCDNFNLNFTNDLNKEQLINLILNNKSNLK